MTLAEERQLYLEAKVKGKLTEWVVAAFNFDLIVEDFIVNNTQTWTITLQPKEARDPRKAHTYYPSELGNCYRNIQIESLLQQLCPNQQRLPPPNTQKVFFAGDMYQDFMVDPIMQWWAEYYHVGHNTSERSFVILIPHPTRANTILYIQGRIDEALKLTALNMVMPIEVKTQSKLLSTLDEPKREHVLQITPYLVVYQAPLGKLLYVEKMFAPKGDEPVTKAFTVTMDWARWQEIITIISYIDDCITDNKLAAADARTDKEKHWKCSYCAHKTLCNKYDPTEVGISDLKGLIMEYAEKL